jgi:hypothetical protein
VAVLPMTYIREQNTPKVALKIVVSVDGIAITLI